MQPKRSRRSNLPEMPQRDPDEDNDILENGNEDPNDESHSDEELDDHWNTHRQHLDPGERVQDDDWDTLIDSDRDPDQDNHNNAQPDPNKPGDRNI